jgi:TetR/AcrR family transcriptional regulator, regulator of cefoperazone and chloramphenicol sensitivity
MSATDDTRQRLLQAAGQVFAAKGFEAATVREICRLADVGNIAAVNYYFRDKERLYIESVKNACASRLDKVPRPDWAPDATTADKLRHFLRAFLGLLLEGPPQPWQLQLMMRELANPSAACAEFVRDLARPNFELVLSIIDEALPPRTSKSKRHLIALSIIGQCIYHRLARPIVGMLVGDQEFQHLDADRLAEHIADFSLAALGLENVAHDRRPHRSGQQRAADR